MCLDPILVGFHSRIPDKSETALLVGKDVEHGIAD